VLQHWRCPVFNRLADDPAIELTVLHSGGFSGTKVVNFRGAVEFNTVEMLTLRPPRFLKAYKKAIPFCPSQLAHLFRENPDVILAEGRSNFLNNFSLLFYSLITGTPYVWWSLGELQAPAHSLGRRIFVYLSSIVERRSAAFLGYSSRARRYFLRSHYSAESIFVAVNCIDTSQAIQQLPASEAESALLKREFGWTAANPVVLFVGALEAEKRVDLLIKAFSDFACQESASRLLIVGDGAERASLESSVPPQLRSRVVFAGRVEEGVGAYFELGDIFVLPGLGGLAISEAMVHGLPIVASSADGCEEDLIVHGENGYLIESGDMTALASAISELVETPRRREEMSRAAKKKVLEKFNIENYMQNVRKSLHYACGQHDNARCN
jgi:glycosyltransferase involved in cell wall biosynthesis